jgi:chemotaxis protein methyltransferase CheR
MTHLVDRALVQSFRDVIARFLGLRFEDDKLPVLAELLERRAADSSVAMPGYLARLQGGIDLAEAAELATVLCVPETYFFRDRCQFRALEAWVDEHRRRRSVAPLRFLSAGCSSGEEPYSVAILLRELLPALARDGAEIVGIDVNPIALQRARRGRYTQWSLRETPSELGERYFRRAEGVFELDESVRCMVRIEHGNLLIGDQEVWQTGTIDVVLCRNVLMYLSPDACRRLLDRIARALRPGGLLFLGHAENLRGLSTSFGLIHTHGTFYYARTSESHRPERAGEHLVTGEPPDAIPGPSELCTSFPEVDWYQTIGRSTARIAELADGPRTTVATDAVPRTTRSPSSPPLGVALDLMQRELFSEALAALDELGAAQGSDPDALLLRAVLLVNAGDVRAAGELCSEALAADQLNAGAHYIKALCSEQLGDLGAAMEHDETAVYLDASFAMPHLHLGLLARRRGDLTAARRELELALALLAREDAARIVLFGGGFRRNALINVCRAQLSACGGLA